MIIDILFIIIVVLALVKGLSRGFIVAAFSLVALIAGLAAALKLSVVMASHLKDAMHIAAKWLPLVAFLVTFILVVLLVRLLATALQKAVELVWLGWINKLLGMLLFLALYIIILSVLLFYAEKMVLVNAETIASSKTYEYIKPWGPKAMNAIGSLVPVFKDMFHQLEDFFAGVSTKIEPR